MYISFDITLYYEDQVINYYFEYKLFKTCYKQITYSNIISKSNR